MNEWRYHEKEGGWVGSYYGIAVVIESECYKAPPQYSPKDWLDHSPDSPLNARKNEDRVND